MTQTEELIRIAERALEKWRIHYTGSWLYDNIEESSSPEAVRWRACRDALNRIKEEQNK